MTPPLFLLEQLPDPRATVLVLGGAEGRHASTVLRLAVGEHFLASDGQGSVWHCAVTQVSAGQVTADVGERYYTPPSQPRVVIAQALAKGDRSEFAVELMTELGVDEVVPWSAARSVVQWRGEDKIAKALQRWRSTAREATKQSRRAWIPEIGGLASTRQLCARAEAAEVALILDADASSALVDTAWPSAGDVLLIVGPEGGIGTDELDQLEAVGARRVRLGAHVLRTSTAGGAALAAMSPGLGRWR